MSKAGRPPNIQAAKHPLHGQFNGDVPWLDGCREHQRATCLDCPVSLQDCPAQNPRVHKGGRRKSGGQAKSV